VAGLTIIRMSFDLVLGWQMIRGTIAFTPWNLL